MSPLRKGSRCHAPALCLSQWRGWVYATFHLWDKENHRSSWNGGIFRVFRAGGFDEINRRRRNFNYSNREVLDLPVGGRNKKENTEVFAVLPSWNDEKEEHFLRHKVTVMTWKMVEKIWNLSKNIFGESLTKCAPGGHEKTIINRKSREPFFKYGSLRLNDLSWGQEEIEKNPWRTQLACHRTAHIGHGQHVQWNPTVSKHEALTIDTSSTVRSTNDTLVFLIRVGSLASSFASTWVSDERGRSASQSSGNGKTLRQKFSQHHHHRQLCSLHCAASAWPQTYRATACRRPHWKIHCGRTEQERRLLLALFHDDTRQSPSRSMRRSRWTHRASAAAPRPKGAANEPTWWRKETHEAKIKLRTRTVTASTSTSSLVVHLQKLAAVFTFLELEVEESLDDQATV